MKVIINNIIPFDGYKYINLFGYIFTKDKNYVMTQKDENHESIHTLQMKYLLYIFFYIIYYLEWSIKIPIALFCNTGRYGVLRYAYRSISFEQVAYLHQTDYQYLENANPYEWIKFIFKMYQL